MNFVFQLLVLAASATVGSSGDQAITCEGSWYEKAKGEMPASQQRRRYILNEGDRTVDYWNEVREIKVPFCDRSYEKCTIDFEPTKISGNARLNSVGWSMLDISRRSGSIHLIWGGKGGIDQQYFGTCEPSEMPRPHSDRNLF